MRSWFWIRHLTRRDVAAVGLAAAGCSAVGLLALQVVPRAAIVLQLAAAVAVLVAAVLASLRAGRSSADRAQLAVLAQLSQVSDRLAIHVDAKLDVQLRQVEALLSLHSALRPEAPLPSTRGWAASSDLAGDLVREVFARRPRLVVECGSGTSSVLLALALRRCGAGRLVSLEHDAAYAEATRAALRLHGLADHCEVVLAPLRPVRIGDQDWLWYDLERVRAAIDAPIDLLFVDGPPGHVQPLSRYPAVPLLRAQLTADVLVVLDDGARSDEQKIAERWVAECGLRSESVAFEKGGFRLTRAP